MLFRCLGWDAWAHHACATGDGTRLAGEAARAVAGRVLGGRRGGCGVRGRSGYELFADHLAAHSKEATVRNGPSCALHIANSAVSGDVTMASPPLLCGPLIALGALLPTLSGVEQPSALHERVRLGGRALSLPSIAATMLAGGTRANRTYRRNQRVAGASAGGSKDARYRARTRS